MKFNKLVKLLTEKDIYVEITSKPKNLDQVFGKISDDNTKVLNKIKGSILIESLTENLRELLAFKKYNPPDIYLNTLIPVFFDYFIEEENIRALSDLANGKEIFKIKINKRQSIYDVASSYASYKINPNFFKELSLKDAKGTSGTAIGKGEFLLGLFSNLMNAEGAGDLQFPDKSPVEVKGPRGRFKGQYATRIKSQVQNDLFNILLKLNYPKYQEALKAFSSTKSIGTTLFPILYDIFATYQKDDKVLSTLISTFRSTNSNIKISSSDLNLLRNIIKKQNNNDLISFLLAIHLYEYNSLEKFHYLLLFAKGYEEFILYDLSSTNGISELQNMLAMNKLELASWADTPRESAFGLSIK